ncbi:MAG TPA: HDOD domain-containing protein [Bacteroidota bacterium]|nr:HDOD domain-containing protein [Bacteroidota bacterium]
MIAETDHTRGKMTRDRIREKVKTIIQLPALPAVAKTVTDLADDPRTSAAKLGKIISADQALTAKVLKIANSPFYGYPKRISTVQFAIIVMGFEVLKELVTGISLVSSIEKDGDEAFEGTQFWEHSISTGSIAHRLAQDLGYRVSGEVFVAGLLHDMGVTVLHRYFNKDFHEVREMVRNTGCRYLEAEEQVLGVTHADVGGWLAERWNLPDHLAEAIRFHHTPSVAAKNPELAALTHCADMLANRISPAPADFDRGNECDDEACRLLGLDGHEALEEYARNYSEVLQDAVQHSKDLIMRHGGTL